MLIPSDVTSSPLAATPLARRAPPRRPARRQQVTVNLRFYGVEQRPEPWASVTWLETGNDNDAGLH